MIAKQAERLLLSGNLTMATVPALYKAGLQSLTEGDLLVDMAQVASVDSAAVSMLLAWSRAAQARQRIFRVENIPADLLSLANLYGVAEMLPQ